MKSPARIRGQYCLERTIENLSESLSSLGTRERAIQTLKELFRRPYLPSRELCEKFSIDKEDLKSIYFFIRSSKEARDLFEFSAYHYLTKILEHLSKDGERTSKIISGKIPFPLAETMELFISENCNAKCKFCYRNGKTYEEKRVLSTEEYGNLINEFADLHGKNLDISGGLEPLQSPSILSILKTGLDRNLKVSLYTNGITLNNPDIVNHLMKIYQVRVSLTAHDKKSYKEAMGVDKFDVVIDNLKNLVEAKKDSKSNVRIGTSFVVYKENYTHILEAIRLAQKLDIDFFDLRSAEVTDLGNFYEEQRKRLGSILQQVRQEKSSGTYGKLNVSVADTLNTIIDPTDDFSKYLNEDFASALPYFRVTVTPQGKIYALNLIGQPSREDDRYLLGEINKNGSLSDVLNNRRPIPFEPRFLLAHDITLIAALSKLKSDLEFGISPEESPFNWR